MGNNLISYFQSPFQRTSSFDFKTVPADSNRNKKNVKQVGKSIEESFNYHSDVIEQLGYAEHGRYKGVRRIHWVQLRCGCQRLFASRICRDIVLSSLLCRCIDSAAHFQRQICKNITNIAKLIKNYTISGFAIQ